MSLHLEQVKNRYTIRTTCTHMCAIYSDWATLGQKDVFSLTVLYLN